jgi:hypothetical protein
MEGLADGFRTRFQEERSSQRVGDFLHPEPPILAFEFYDLFGNCRRKPSPLLGRRLTP